MFDLLNSRCFPKAQLTRIWIFTSHSATTCDQGAIDRTIHFKLFKSLSLRRNQWPMTISRHKICFIIKPRCISHLKWVSLGILSHNSPQKIFIRKLGLERSSNSFSKDTLQNRRQDVPIEPRKKNGLTFQYTGCLIRILTWVYYNPHNTGQYNPLYTLNNQGFFHCSIMFPYPIFHNLSLISLCLSRPELYLQKESRLPDGTNPSFSFRHAALAKPPWASKREGDVICWIVISK